jgi:hypothetical protein
VAIQEPNTTATAPAAEPTPTPSVGPGALRIVLFGMPAAGKSSLLGAVAQAAQTQEHLLNGRLIDRSHGLAELQKRLYEERSRPTAEEVVPYPIEFEPFSEGDKAGTSKLEGLLIDCDGRVANDLLGRRRSLNEDSPEGTLAREVLEADTLVLVVDAAAPASQIDSDFLEFGRFLRLLERSRGQRSEVGGLPVFLVLTKCDLLARPEDTSVEWLERIEERKRQVHARFQDFLNRQAGEHGPLPFGRIDLHLWATAVKRPPLGPTPAKPREPYGVGELFRQCIEYAHRFRENRKRSSRRLLVTVGGSVGALAVMAGLAATLIFGSSDNRPPALVAKVESYRSREGSTASTRLTEPGLQTKISELADLRNDRDFNKLPEDLQKFVIDSLKEMQAYRDYKQQLQQVRPVTAARSENDLKEIEETLTTKLALPPAYETQWANTQAALLRAERLKDIKAIRPAVDRVEDWYRRLREEGNRLLRFAIDKPGAEPNWAAWHEQFRKLIETADNPEFREADPLPGSPTLTYKIVLQFNRVAEARAEWEAVKQRLERVRDMAAAFGLIGPLPERPPLLVFPRAPDFTVHDARIRLLDLQKAYPRYKDDFTLTDLSDGVAGPLRKAAQAGSARLLEAGRQEVERQLNRRAGPDHRETPELWRDLRTWLSTPDDLTAWRNLAKVVGRLADPDWVDPVTTLVAFLNRDRFDLDLKRGTLEVPIALDVTPRGKLAIFHPKTSPQGPALVFTLEGPQSDTERRTRSYTLRPEGDGKGLVYHPGEELWATLPVENAGKPDWMLTWARSRSEVFQFEHLATPPQLHRKDQDLTRGEVAQGVALTFTPAPGVPPVPELVPVVKLEKR